MLHVSTMKNGNPRDACSVKGGVGEVLPIPHRRCQNIPILCSEVG